MSINLVLLSPCELKRGCYGSRPKFFCWLSHIDSLCPFCAITIRYLNMVTCVRSLALVWLAAFSLSRCRSACNMSKYQEWYDSTYSELLEETQLRAVTQRRNH